MQMTFKQRSKGQKYSSVAQTPFWQSQNPEFNSQYQKEKKKTNTQKTREH